MRNTRAARGRRVKFVHTKDGRKLRVGSRHILEGPRNCGVKSGLGRTCRSPRKRHIADFWAARNPPVQNDALQKLTHAAYLRGFQDGRMFEQSVFVESIGAFVSPARTELANLVKAGFLPVRGLTASNAAMQILKSNALTVPPHGSSGTSPAKISSGRNADTPP